jgi:acetoacetate decarboxylase
MGFVRTAAELARIQRLLGEPRFVAGRQLRVEFLTSPDVITRLLPPPLIPASQPLVSVTVGQWHSNGFGDFAGGSIYLAASHEGEPGGYALTMWMNREPAMAFGREVFGEPKKLATVRLRADAERHEASVERNGVALLTLSGERMCEADAREQTRIAFNYRSRTAADGVGLEGPAVLTRATFTERVRLRLQGDGTVQLHGSVHDPLEELEIVSVLGATYCEQDIAGRCEPIASVAAEDFLPFHHGRADDWLALDTAGAGAGAGAGADRRVE